MDFPEYFRKVKKIQKGIGNTRKFLKILESPRKFNIIFSVLNIIIVMINSQQVLSNLEKPSIITDPEFWADNDRKIEARFAQRKARLRDFCENTFRQSS